MTSVARGDCQPDIDATEHGFHSSMRLYVLAEHRPRQDAPDCIDVSCVRRGDTEFMLAYVSPIDARLEQENLNLSGHRYRTIELTRLNPLPFIESHGGSFNLCVVYGFAAHANQLSADPQTRRASLALGVRKTFMIPREMRGHFGIDFGDMHTLFGRVFTVAGLPLHADTLDSLAEDAPEQIDRMATDARQRIKQRIWGGEGSQFAVCDPVSRKWRFGPIARIRTHRPS